MRNPSIVLPFVMGALFLSACTQRPTDPQRTIVQAESEQQPPPSEKKESAALIPAEIEASSTPAPASDPEGAPSVPPTSSVSKQIAIAPPTDEQLARWKQPEYSALDLVACYDSAEFPLATEIAATADGEHVVVAGIKLGLWSIKEAKPKHIFQDLSNPDKNHFFTALEVAPDGKWFATGDDQGWLRLWSLVDQSEIAAKQVNKQAVKDIAIDPNGDAIATISYDPQVMIWKSSDLQPVSTIKVNTNGLKRIEYMAPQRLVAAGETMSVWNTADGTQVERIESDRYQSTLARRVIADEFVYGSDTGFHFCRTTDGEPLRLVQGNLANDTRLCFSAERPYMAATAGRSIEVFDIEQNRCVQVMDGYGSAIVGIVWLPESNALVSMNETGRLRVWANAQSSESLALTALHAPIIPPAVNNPATSSQLLAAFDVRTLPRLPHDRALASEPTMLNYSGTFSKEEAKVFYHYLMTERGWDLQPGNPLTPDYLHYAKGGFVAFLSISAQGATTNVNLTSLGNFDLRTVPKFDKSAVEVNFENESTVLYKTEAELLTVESSLLRELHQAGWTAYARLNSSKNELADSRDIHFLKGGIDLSVNITKDATDAAKCLVRYTKFTSLHALPIPEDCGFVEFDGSREPHLVALTKMSLDDAAKYYDREMESQGWLKRKRWQSQKKDRQWTNYVQGQRDLVVGFLAKDQNRTMILVGDNLQASSWQLKENKSDQEAAKDSNTEDPNKLQAADFPQLAPKSEVTFDTESKIIHIKVETESLLDIASQSLEIFAKLGWKPTREGIRDKDYVFLTFGKEKGEIDLRANRTGKLATISVQGSGLSWTKPLAMKPQVISYEAWLRRNAHPASLDLLENYVEEMKAIEKQIASQ